MAANPQLLHGKSSLFGTSGVLNGIVYRRCKIVLILTKKIINRTRHSFFGQKMIVIELSHADKRVGKRSL